MSVAGIANNITVGYFAWLDVIWVPVYFGMPFSRTHQRSRIISLNHADHIRKDINIVLISFGNSLPYAGYDAITYSTRW